MGRRIVHLVEVKGVWGSGLDDVHDLFAESETLDRAWCSRREGDSVRAGSVHLALDPLSAG